MSKPKTKPAKKWSQIRISPEEEALIRKVAAEYGISFTTAGRQLIRRGLSLPAMVSDFAVGRARGI